jgi:hypothetical protein
MHYDFVLTVSISFDVKFGTPCACLHTCFTNLLSWKTLIPMDGKEVNPKGGEI